MTHKVSYNFSIQYENRRYIYIYKWENIQISFLHARCCKRIKYYVTINFFFKIRSMFENDGMIDDVIWLEWVLTYCNGDHWQSFIVVGNSIVECHIYCIFLTSSSWFSTFLYLLERSKSIIRNAKQEYNICEQNNNISCIFDVDDDFI